MLGVARIESAVTPVAALALEQISLHIQVLEQDKEQRASCTVVLLKEACRQLGHLGTRLCGHSTDIFHHLKDLPVSLRAIKRRAHALGKMLARYLAGRNGELRVREVLVAQRRVGSQSRPERLVLGHHRRS